MPRREERKRLALPVERLLSSGGGPNVRIPGWKLLIQLLLKILWRKSWQILVVTEVMEVTEVTGVRELMQVTEVLEVTEATEVTVAEVTVMVGMAKIRMLGIAAKVKQASPELAPFSTLFLMPATPKNKSTFCAKFALIL